MPDPRLVECNAEGIALIKEFEGLRLEAYRCPAMKWTIGYGHTGSNIKEGSTITETIANRLLRSDIDNIHIKLKSMIKTPLNENQWSAIVCLVFNVGIYAFQKSRLLKCINANQPNCVREEWIAWCHYKEFWSGKMIESDGLKRRRKAEYELFIKEC